MTLIPFEDKDYLEEARGYVTTQFENKDVFDRYLQLLLSGYDSVQDVLRDLLQLRGIDESAGEQLDIIGRIVGQPRQAVVASLIQYFGFSPNLQANAFGNLDNPAAGGRFRSLNESISSLRPLTDDEYRLFIKAKIIKNVGRATAEDIINSIKFILPDIGTVFIDEGVGEFTVTVSRPISVTEALLITDSNIIPKPVGVTLNVSFVVGELGWSENWGQVWDN